MAFRHMQPWVFIGRGRGPGIAGLLDREEARSSLKKSQLACRGVTTGPIPHRLGIFGSDRKGFTDELLRRLDKLAIQLAQDRRQRFRRCKSWNPRVTTLGKSGRSDSESYLADMRGGMDPVREGPEFWSWSDEVTQIAVYESPSIEQKVIAQRIVTEGIEINLFGRSGRVPEHPTTQGTNGAEPENIVCKSGVIKHKRLGTWRRGWSPAQADQASGSAP
ncbi:uncharacterized protein EI90DRAFT_3015847 [Cantharellus anzutake]|uniref:uncharacterized protein n=1 Tax=Cantharellus anzutake TaxID=1750568 RepID=UPI001907A289|nr:uncharacterized protein EI90DRAFT_3015847 [Cantharellus anzutake]KAF8332844.1 hypothetical protein EI90DRAFT_3015847 [Cantharellus anzutake]